MQVKSIAAYAILSTFIRLPIVIKIFVLPFFSDSFYWFFTGCPVPEEPMILYMFKYE